MLVAGGQLPRPWGHEWQLKKGDKEKNTVAKPTPKPGKPATPKPGSSGKLGKGGGDINFWN